MLKRAIKRSAYFLAPNSAARFDQRLWLSKQAKLLHNRCKTSSNLEERVDELFNFATFSVNQKKKELLLLLKLLREIQPKYVCEIGAEGGGTLFLFCQVAAPNARILSIDINYTRVQRHAYSRFARRGQKITCLSADSHAAATIATVTKWLGPNKFDFLFIDGDHSMAGVSADYGLYSPYVQQGGIIAFHDIVPDHMTRYGIATGSYVGHVPAFWRSLKETTQHTCEFVEDPEQDGFGIGVLQKAAITQAPLDSRPAN